MLRRYPPALLPAVYAALIVLLIVPAAHASTQESTPTTPRSPHRFTSQHWTSRDGLPTNALRDIVQGPAGYLWIASDHGLIRFDGHTFTVFDRHEIPGLASAVFTTLTLAHDGMLWCGTRHSGVVRYRAGTLDLFNTGDDFEARYVTQIEEDDRGRMWVLTQRGVGVIDGDRFTAVPELAYDGGRAAIAIDHRDGGIWFAEGDRKRVVRWRDGQADEATVDTRISSKRGWMEAGPDGTTLIADYNGPTVFDRDLHVVPGDTVPRAEKHTAYLQFFLTDRSGERWIATEDGVFHGTSNGYVRYPAVTGTVTRIAVDRHGALWAAAEKRLYRDSRVVFEAPSRIRDFVIDNHGDLWVTTEFSGLFDVRPSVFQVYAPGQSIYAVRESSSGSVWVCSWRVGVFELEGRTDPIPPYILPYSVVEQPPGVLWIGTQQGITRVRGDKSFPDPDAGRYRVATALEKDRDGNVWIASEDALLCHDGTKVTRYLYDGKQLPPYPVTEIFADTSRGDMWFGTAGGGIVRRHDGTFETLGPGDGLPSGLIQSLYVDASGTVWAGTLGAGLVRVKPAQSRPLSGARIGTITAADGLYQDDVDAIIEDDEGRMWMGGRDGISWAHRDSLDAFADGRRDRVECVSYSEADGLLQRSVNGVGHPSALKTSDGRLWFCTQDGLAVVDPATISTGDVHPPVLIEKLDAESATFLPRRDIQLDASQRQFQIAYTSPDPADARNVQFRYRLDGLDNDWTEAGNRRVAYFTNVPPGRYTFRVAAARPGAAFGESADALSFTVAPFFYETVWFRGGLVAGILLLLVTVMWYRVNQQHRREETLRHQVDERTRDLVDEKETTERARRVAEEQRAIAERALHVVEKQSQELEELHETKSRFFANVSHEFRTPLTLTIGPLQDLLEGHLGDLDPDARGSLEMALRNSRRLLDLVNQILDLAKLEAGRLELEPATLDMVAFLRGVAGNFTDWARRQKVGFDVTLPDAPVDVTFDADVMERVVTNLLSNSFKFTPAGGRVALVMEERNEDVRIEVHDTGPGIPADERELVFSRFYQSRDSRGGSAGTGIGLSLAHDLTLLHGGTIRIEPGAERGSVFVVTLPRSGVGAGDGVSAPERPWRGRDAFVEPAPREADAAGADADEPGDRKTVLVVDDNPEIRTYLRPHLGTVYRMVEAADGDEALRVAREDTPDLVISDVMMPGMDGFELCARMKSDPDLDFIPLILLTAKGATDDRIAGLERGADDYLPKPFHMEELLARSANLIESRRRLRERFAGTAPAPSEMARELSAADVLVERFVAVVEAEMEDEDLSVQAVADRLGVDRSYLYRRVNETTSLSPTDVIRNLRLERAAGLLREQAGSVGEVAYSVGFKSVSHFCQSFRRKYGVTPASYASTPNE